MAMPAPLPNLSEATQLPVDRLAIHVLWYMADIAPKYERRASFLLGRLRDDLPPAVGQPRVTSQGRGDLDHPAARAYNEAWESLAVRGLITQSAVSDYRDWWTVSRLGARVAREPNPIADLRSAALLDADLHPAIRDTVRSLYNQGQHELAAFEAMRQVEIRVRDLAGGSDRDIGTHLMRHAFNPETGSLSDPQQDKGERQATSDLFAGAIGTFKNPTSHRQVTYNDPTEAADVALLADLLLRILDRRAATLSSGP
jgi:uncharacterized protein (TIGR02391 family)